MKTATIQFRQAFPGSILYVPVIQNFLQVAARSHICERGNFRKVFYNQVVELKSSYIPVDKIFTPKIENHKIVEARYRTTVSGEQTIGLISAVDPLWQKEHSDDHRRLALIDIRYPGASNTRIALINPLVGDFRHGRFESLRMDSECPFVRLVVFHPNTLIRVRVSVKGIDANQMDFVVVCDKSGELKTISYGKWVAEQPKLNKVTISTPPPAATSVVLAVPISNGGISKGNLEDKPKQVEKVVSKIVVQTSPPPAPVAVPIQQPKSPKPTVKEAKSPRQILPVDLSDLEAALQMSCVSKEETYKSRFGV